MNTGQDDLVDFPGLPKQKHRYWARWRSAVAQIKLESSQNNSWFDLIDDLAVRLVKPRYSVPFVMYLLTGVLLLGGVAIWVEIVKYSISSHFYYPSSSRPRPDIEAILAAIHTFYPALAWSATMQLVLADAPAGEADGRPHKRLRALALFLGSVVLVLAVVVMSLAEVLLPSVSLAFGLLGVLIAIVLWWIANAEDDTYKDSPRSIGLAPKGGAAVPNAPLPGSAPSTMFEDDE
ncbi:hypothetical protein [Sphingomonas aerolata]|uniref:hypothetical protein n=1 Tax=Sphingomonas aerolata TaxID=185951 RepID=UPI002FE0CDF3